MKALRRKAFNLVEIIIATLIVVAGMIPIFDMLGSARRTVASVEDETVAFSLATEACEWMRAFSWTDLRFPVESVSLSEQLKPQPQGRDFLILQDPVFSFETASGSRIEYEPSSFYSRFKRKIYIHEPDEHSGIKVEVEVSWKNEAAKGGDLANLSLEFMVYPVN